MRRPYRGTEADTRIGRTQCPPLRVPETERRGFSPCEHINDLDHQRLAPPSVPCPTYRHRARFGRRAAVPHRAANGEERARGDGAGRGAAPGAPAVRCGGTDERADARRVPGVAIGSATGRRRRERGASLRLKPQGSGGWNLRALRRMEPQGSPADGGLRAPADGTLRAPNGRGSFRTPHSRRCLRLRPAGQAGTVPSLSGLTTRGRRRTHSVTGRPAP